MGHPSRQKFITQLHREMPDAEVVMDRENDRWETGRRALLAYDPNASHHCITQDDAILCRDYTETVEVVAEAAGERPVGLYVGSPRPHADVVLTAMKRAKREKLPWIEMAGPWWGVAIIIPTSAMPELVEWGDLNPRIKNYDRRVSRYFEKLGIDCWYTVPSLVDHRPVAQNPSLIKGRTGDRRAYSFVGTKTSPLSIDWTRGPVRVAETIAFRHRNTQVVREVALNGPRHRRMSKSPLWEVA